MGRVVKAADSGAGAGRDVGLGELRGRRAGGRGSLRPGFVLAVFGLGLLAPAVVPAQPTAPKPLIGRRVVQCVNDFTLHIQSRVIDPRRVIHFYKVEEANGPWVWLRAEDNGFAGWALADRVIPVEEGIEYFTEQIRANPGNVFPYVMRAMLWQDRNEIDKALKDYDEVLRLDPSRGWIYNDRGILHMERKQYDLAKADFDEAIRLEPRSANVYNNRGTLRRERKVYDLAIEDFNQATLLNPEYIGAYYNRGLTWMDKKEYDQAIADFNEVIRLDPEDGLAFYHRGLAWMGKTEYTSAIRDFDRALQRDGKLAFVYLDRGIARAALKDYTQAIADYDQAARLSAKNPKVFYHRGLARVEIKQFEGALADFDAAIRLDPRFDEAYLSRAWLLASCPNTRLRDPERAVESATKACELTAWHEAHDLGGLAAVYAETGNVAAALKWQSKAIELMTGDEKNKLNQAFILGHP